jgi:hypothetical protein
MPLLEFFFASQVFQLRAEEPCCPSKKRNSKMSSHPKCPWSTRSPAFPPDTESTTVQFVTQALKLLHQVWHLESGKDYWIRDGSLLGAFRHSGFIPGDTDADLAMILDDDWTFQEVLNHVDQRFQELAPRYAIRQDGAMHAQIVCIRPWLPPVGLKVWKKYRWSRIHLVDLSFGVKPKRMELGTCRFGDIELLAPIDAKPILHILYGENYMTPQANVFAPPLAAEDYP